jgi:hypothetical protein
MSGTTIYRSGCNKPVEGALNQDLRSLVNVMFANRSAFSSTTYYTITQIETFLTDSSITLNNPLQTVLSQGTKWGIFLYKRTPETEEAVIPEMLYAYNPSMLSVRIQNQNIFTDINSCLLQFDTTKMQNKSSVGDCLAHTSTTSGSSDCCFAGQFSYQ